jgi:hypothetical protein
MNRWRVGEDRGSKETDGCPLTPTARHNGTSETHQSNLLGNCASLDEKYRLSMVKNTLRAVC